MYIYISNQKTDKPTDGLTRSKGSYTFKDFHTKILT